jgi:hypothetical protein
MIMIMIVACEQLSEENEYFLVNQADESFVIIRENVAIRSEVVHEENGLVWATHRRVSDDDDYLKNSLVSRTTNLFYLSSINK